MRFTLNEFEFDLLNCCCCWNMGGCCCCWLGENVVGVIKTSNSFDDGLFVDVSNDANGSNVNDDDDWVEVGQSEGWTLDNFIEFLSWNKRKTYGEVGDVASWNWPNSISWEAWTLDVESISSPNKSTIGAWVTVAVFLLLVEGWN